MYRLLLVVLAMIVNNTSSRAQSVYADSTFFQHYPYIVLLDDTVQIPTVSDEEFYKKSSKVIFRVGKTYLNTQAASIQELITKIIPRMNADSLQLQYMLIRGAASPEGSFERNVQLGKGRCATLFNFINSRLKFPAAPGRYNQESVPEDYDNLCRLLRDANDPILPQVQEIVDTYAPSGNYATLKEKLNAHNNKRTWEYLLANYFPQLRSANVMFFFKKYVPIEKKLSSGLKFDQMKFDTPRITGGIAFEPLDAEPSGRLVRRHIIALRTNFIYDFFYMPKHYWAPSPNIQMEYYPKSGHFTANLGFTCPYWHRWNKHQFWQIRDYIFEGRYYFKGQGQFIGPYLSAYIQNNIYGLGFDEKEGYEGEGLGAGLMGGWVLNISKNKRWRLEFSLGVGYYETRYDPYVYGNPLSMYKDGLYYYDYTGKISEFKERNHRFRWFGPTNIGIHLTYDLLYRRIQNRGVSFNRTEAIIQHEPVIIQKGGER